MGPASPALADRLCHCATWEAPSRITRSLAHLQVPRQGQGQPWGPERGQRPSAWELPPLPQGRRNPPPAQEPRKLPIPIRNRQLLILDPLFTSEMIHTLSVGYVSPGINPLSLYYGSLLNSLLCEGKKPQWAAIAGIWMWPRMWPSSQVPLSFLK